MSDKKGEEYLDGFKAGYDRAIEELAKSLKVQEPIDSVELLSDKRQAFMAGEMLIITQIINYDERIKAKKSEDQ